MEQMLCDGAFLLFSAMLRVVAFVWGGRSRWGLGSPDCVASPNHAYLKKTLGSSVIYSVPTGRPMDFFLFKDVEKKMELKSPETPHPWESWHMPSPSPTKNAGISLLQTPTSPNHVAEAEARVSSP